MMAFKEWDVVCQALAEGRQDVIVRKGGIAEGRGGFSFEHEVFLLFPTRFHAQGERVRVPWEGTTEEWQVGEELLLTHGCEVIAQREIRDWEGVQALAGRHIWTEETVRERFDWAGKGMAVGSVQVAEVRCWALPRPLRFLYEKKYGGCRSWVEVPDPEGGIPVGS